jgi:hypothetical protein
MASRRRAHPLVLWCLLALTACGSVGEDAGAVAVGMADAVRRRPHRSSKASPIVAARPRESERLGQAERHHAPSAGGVAIVCAPEAVGVARRDDRATLAGRSLRPRRARSPPRVA